jgi:hypothetical protein
MAEDVFVIMQIGEKNSSERRRADEVADYILAPVLAEFNLKLYRADRDPTPGQITPQMVKSIVSAPLVIADLTGRNPNVYYELAVAHSFGRPVIIFCDKVTSLAFDTKDERIIEIGDIPTLSQAEEAKKELREALKVILSPGHSPTSIISEIAAAQSLDNLAPDNPITSLATELSAIKEGVDEIREVMNTTGNEAFRLTWLEYSRLKDFVEKLVAKRRFSPVDIENMITGETSVAFDNWVHSLADSLRAARTAGARDDPSSGSRLTRTGIKNKPPEEPEGYPDETAF